jgi:hypothetical protein
MSRTCSEAARSPSSFFEQIWPLKVKFRAVATMLCSPICLSATEQVLFPQVEGRYSGSLKRYSQLLQLLVWDRLSARTLGPHRHNSFLFRRLPPLPCVKLVQTVTATDCDNFS